tara:strand:+ start:1614 stop:1943 length:330 start_codon:yes stop_codon:yes gene_type:complete
MQYSKLWSLHNAIGIVQSIANSPNLWKQRDWSGMDSLLTGMLKSYKYDKIESELWSDSAGQSLFIRVGDHHCVSFWTGEDMVFIYSIERDTPLSEWWEQEREPLFAMHL